MSMDKRKKLLIIIPSPISLKIFLGELIKRLRAEEFDIFVACKKYQQFDRVDGVTYHFIQFDRNVNLLGAFKASREVRKLVKEIKPDIIHSHFSSSSLITYFAKSRKWPQSLATIQGAISTSEIGVGKRFLYLMAEIFSFRSFDRTYVLSEDDFVKLAPFVPRLKLQKSVGFGCNLDSFSPMRPGIYGREDLRIGLDDFVIIYVGRMVSFKGFPLVIRTFKMLEGRLANVKLIICGQPDPIHPSGLSVSEQDYLRDNPNIIKTGFTKEVFDYLKLADLNFFPSRREGMPVNLMESIASGVPVVTSNARGCRHVVHHDVDGIVVDHHDVNAYAKCIESLIQDRRKHQQLRNNCNATRVLFDREKFIAETIATYRDLIQKR